MSSQASDRSSRRSASPSPPASFEPAGSYRYLPSVTSRASPASLTSIIALPAESSSSLPSNPSAYIAAQRERWLEKLRAQARDLASRRTELENLNARQSIVLRDGRLVAEDDGTPVDDLVSLMVRTHAWKRDTTVWRDEVRERLGFDPGSPGGGELQAAGSPSRRAPPGRTSNWPRWPKKWRKRKDPTPPAPPQDTDSAAQQLVPALLDRILVLEKELEGLKSEPEVCRRCFSATSDIEHGATGTYMRTFDARLVPQSQTPSTPYDAP